MRALGFVLVLTAAPLAAADSYSCPSSDGLFRCPAEVSVPEGCPIHFVLGHDVVPADVRATVNRAGTDVDVAGVSTTVTVQHPVRTKDKLSCFCDEITVARPFDEYTLPVTGVVAGELVEVQAPVFASVTITAAAPCPTFTYATDFHDPIACDLCPMPPDDDDTGDDQDDGVASCATAPSSSGLLLIASLALVLSRSRRRASRPCGRPRTATRRSGTRA